MGVGSWELTMPPPPDAPFHTIAIAGLGLIGGSIALAVGERWPSIRIIGVDRPSVLAHALGSGAIERGVATIDEIGAPDLVVLAAPVRQNAELLHRLAAMAGDSTDPSLRTTIVTDVGGTKRDIVAVATSLGAGYPFIGGHPIGGAERGGFGFARPDLFAGRPWILTPGENTPADALAKVEEFVAGLGARPARLRPEDHDRLMAYISHLPQLTASALMSVVGSRAGAGLKLAGRGLVDTTRLASSPATVWKDISVNNADFIGEALDTLIVALTELRSDLQRGNTLETMFGAAERWRGELMKGRD
jgi:prephenate dehydrogenase